MLRARTYCLRCRRSRRSYDQLRSCCFHYTRRLNSDINIGALGDKNEGKPGFAANAAARRTGAAAPAPSAMAKRATAAVRRVLGTLKSIDNAEDLLQKLCREDMRRFVNESLVVRYAQPKLIYPC